LGFYRSRYKDKGKTKYLATTQFEAADARRAFPCWDSPEAKATFDISIITKKHFEAISNMPEISRKKVGDKIYHKFARTPIMSTYLLYLGVGEFEFLTGKTGKLVIRIITTKGNKSNAKYSLDLTKKLIPAYEKYFGIKYPLPKLDLIAIPDFASGAMENWGSITFRESFLLYNPKTSSTKTKQFIAEVISHEIAHQWFGNLVTMKWWNDLWLNESFATFMEIKFVDQFYPEWNLWDQFLEGGMNHAMALDALHSTHPINVEVNSPSEIREIFDAISYEKGGCILRMLENFVGEANFRKGLKNFLAKFKYKNAEGNDLWTEIGKASKLPIKNMLNSWLNQEGFPLVNVTQHNSKLTFSQNRFLMEKNQRKDTLWPIPLCMGLKKSESKIMLNKKSMTTKSPNSIGFVANLGRKGFYRVKYDEGILLDLKRLVDQKQLSHIDRWAIQNDLFALCVSGDESIHNYLDFSDAYFDEDSYLPKVNVANNLNFLFFVTYGESFSEEIKLIALPHFQKIISEVGWDPKKTDKHTDALLRSMALFTLGKLEDKQVSAEAEKRFKKFLKSPSSLHPDLREPVFSIVCWNGNEKTHKQMITLFKKAKSIEEKLQFLTALANFKNEKLLIKTLNFILTDDVRSQNMFHPIWKMASNPFGKRILWPWLKQHWKQLTKKIGYGNPLFNRIISCLSLFANAKMEPEIKRFFKNNPTPGTERVQQQAIEKIRIHSKFRDRLRADFTKN